MTETDQGDYTCTVKSGLTDSIGDRIVYELIVQTPPVAPVLSIENVTFTGIQISWRGARYALSLNVDIDSNILIDFTVRLRRLYSN